MKVTPRLAAFAADLVYEKLPPDVIERSRMFVLDGAAVMVGAAAYARENNDRMLGNYLKAVAPADGPSSCRKPASVAICRAAEGCSPSRPSKKRRRPSRQ